MSATGICYDCKKREGLACPLCGKFVCEACAEKPYAFCCDVEYDESGGPMERIEVGGRASKDRR